MWLSRSIGVTIAACGAALLAAMWVQLHDRGGGYPLIVRIGIPGVLLLAALALVCLMFGVHLAVAPRSAVRRWTPLRPRRS